MIRWALYTLGVLLALATLTITLAFWALGIRFTESET